MADVSKFFPRCGQEEGDLHRPLCPRYPAEVASWEAADLPRGYHDAILIQARLERS